ncbi:1,4-dihydroxy-2-naphthoate octaprenyltransferase [Bifidobacterium ruminantium]|nr:1,4-dihydroxy-2-naphthoate octaprenyltransferase [Bifidobacterium ruminantium]MBU9111713.1 1,4-dihydroxy-2-naphthoate octaprenyltransferase [Bifidobacterium ruminantium]
MRFMRISTWVRGARLKTLPLAIAPVIIGASLSWRGMFVYSQGGDLLHEPCPFFGGQHDLGEMRLGSLVGVCQRSVGWFVLVAVLCGCVALFLQIAANFANDYSDGVRGADEGRAIDSARPLAKMPSAEPDSASVPLPVSQPQRGPARLVASGVNPKKVLAAAGINALIACLCGLAVIALTGYWWFILVGVACLVAGWCYVGGKHPYGYHYLGEIFVFVFFGLVATCGTMFALTGTVSLSGVLGGANVGFIAVAVLCVNNLRDIESDREHGKHTWMTALGRRNGTVFTIVLLAAAILLAVAYAKLQSACAIPTIIMLAITCAICAAVAVAIARKHYGKALPLCTFASLALAAAFVATVAFA